MYLLMFSLEPHMMTKGVTDFSPVGLSGGGRLPAELQRSLNLGLKLLVHIRPAASHGER